MKHVLVYGLVVLGIISLILHSMATQRNTTIPGLVFPSATPTNTPTATVTNTPTMTNTPTKTRTPTVTLTPTPDPAMVSCAAALTTFMVLHNETDEQLLNALDMTSVTTMAQLRANASTITTWSEGYIDAYTSEMRQCLPVTYDLYQQDINAVRSVLVMLFATMISDYPMLQEQMVNYAQITTKRMALMRAVNTEIQTLRTRYPSVDWPRP